MTDCLFCKIKDKEIPAEIVYEDKNTFAILDIHPRSPGHTMVIPKKHSETILDLSESELKPLLAAVQDVVQILKNAVKPDGFTIGINHGRASGQEIDHLHVHILPRFRTDQGYAIQSVVNNQPEESLEEMAQRIKADFALQNKK